MSVKIKIACFIFGTAGALAAVAAVAAEPPAVQSLFPYVIVGRVVDYDNVAYDENGNGISDLYEGTKEYDMWLADIDGEFDPAADYDNDGVSNLDEYLAGTDPFDADDYLHAKTVASRSSAVRAGGSAFDLCGRARAGGGK